MDTYKIEILKRFEETPDTISLRFKIPDDLKTTFAYHSGQFLNIVLDINGEKVQRSYSFSSSPITDMYPQITIKRVSGGVASNYLVDAVEAGEFLETSAPLGRFFDPFESKGEPMHYVLFAAGSGITPIFSILATVLETDPNNKVTLLYSNKNHDAIIFRSDLERLQVKYGARFVVEHFLSSENTKLDAEKIKNVVEENKDTNLKVTSYLCGPNALMDMIENTLIDINFEKSHIHREDFVFIPKQDATQADGAQEEVSIGTVNIGYHTSVESNIKANIDGKLCEVKSQDNESILDALLRESQNPPFSCMAGSCMACIARVREGEVFQPDTGVLSDDQVKDGYTLTCQCKAMSDTVVLDY